MKKKLIALLVAALMIVTMLPAVAMAQEGNAPPQEPAEASSASEATVTRDPSPAGGTGGVAGVCNFAYDAETRTAAFTGTIDWYAADGDKNRPAGNRVGVEIAPAGGVSDVSAAQFKINDGDWNAWSVDNADNNGLWWYPLVTEENRMQPYKITIDWDGDGTVYGPTDYFIDCTGDVTLRGNALSGMDVSFIDMGNWQDAQDVASETAPHDLPWLQVKFHKNLDQISDANKAALKMEFTIQKEGITSSGDHKDEQPDNGANTFGTGTATFVRDSSAVNEQGWIQFTLGDLKNLTHRDFLGLAPEDFAGTYTISMKAIGNEGETIGEATEEVTYDGDAFVTQPEVTFIDATNWKNALGVPAEQTVAPDDLPWIQLKYTIDLTKIQNPADFNYTVKVENAGIAAGGAKTFERSLDLSAAIEAGKETATGYFQIEMGEHKNLTHEDFLNIDADKFAGEYKVTLSATDGDVSDPALAQAKTIAFDAITKTYAEPKMFGEFKGTEIVRVDGTGSTENTSLPWLQLNFDRKIEMTGMKVTFTPVDAQGSPTGGQATALTVPGGPFAVKDNAYIQVAMGGDEKEIQPGTYAVTIDATGNIDGVVLEDTLDCGIVTVLQEEDTQIKPVDPDKTPIAPIEVPGETGAKEEIKCVTGIDTKATPAQVAALFTVPTGGSVEVQASYDDGEGTKLVGTGSTIVLKTADGTVYDTVTVMIPGDIGGFGVIDVGSSIKLNNHILGYAELTGVYFAAADLLQDGTIDIFDSIRENNLILTQPK